jgi:hypothetical protein
MPQIGALAALRAPPVGLFARGARCWGLTRKAIWVARKVDLLARKAIWVAGRALALASRALSGNLEAEMVDSRAFRSGDLLRSVVGQLD